MIPSLSESSALIISVPTALTAILGASLYTFWLRSSLSSGSGFFRNAYVARGGTAYYISYLAKLCHLVCNAVGIALGDSAFCGFWQMLAWWWFSLYMLLFYGRVFSVFVQLVVSAEAVNFRRANITHHPDESVMADDVSVRGTTREFSLTGSPKTDLDVTEAQALHLEDDIKCVELGSMEFSQSTKSLENNSKKELLLNSLKVLSDKDVLTRFILRNHQQLVKMQWIFIAFYQVFRMLPPLLFWLMYPPSRIATAHNMDSQQCRADWTIVNITGLTFFFTIDFPLFSFVFTRRTLFLDNYRIGKELVGMSIIFFYVSTCVILFGIDYLFLSETNSFGLYYVFVDFITFLLVNWNSVRNLDILYNISRTDQRVKVLVEDRPSAQSCSETSRRIHPNMELMRGVLNNPKSYKEFREFLVRDLCAELILFWSDVQALKKLCDKQKTNAALMKVQDMLNVYINEGGPLTINISGAMRAKIKSHTIALQSLTLQEIKALFEEAETEVLELLLEGSFMRFKLEKSKEASHNARGNQNTSPMQRLLRLFA